MKFFDINLYKDWLIDPEYCTPTDPCKENKKFLMKGNERLYISFKEKTIVVIKSNINTQYTYRYDYDIKTKILQSFGTIFCDTKIGFWRYYDEIGNLIEEQDIDKPFKFSISDLIEKFKKEYNIDIEKPKTVFSLYRYEENKYLSFPVYKVGINTNSAITTNFYLIDGITGETIFYVAIKEGSNTSVLTEYQKMIKKQEEEDNAYFNTYKGKDYTKAEWEIFKEQHYKEYKRKKESKGFWHDLFKKHDE